MKSIGGKEESERERERERDQKIITIPTTEWQEIEKIAVLRLNIRKLETKM
jgi:hypothetical protein